MDEVDDDVSMAEHSELKFEKKCNSGGTEDAMFASKANINFFFKFQRNGPAPKRACGVKIFQKKPVDLKPLR